MDNNTHSYIERPTDGEPLYQRLQRETLEELQRLSGKVWTDFNAHDPGVTLADIANYVLGETAYKFSFPNLPDYLVQGNGKLDPEAFGLFSPDKVYTTGPVTTEDYRKLFFSYIPELENVWVDYRADTGGYTVSLVLSPFEEDRENLRKQAAKVYNSHRNLCEYLEQVVVIQPETLTFQAEFEIEAGEDATEVLARVYWKILHYLSGGVRIQPPVDFLTSGLSPEEWLEGSENAVRVVIPQQQNTEYELYKELRKVKGIKSFGTCYLMKDGKPQTDLSGGFSLFIPKKKKDLAVRIRCGRSEPDVDMKLFVERLKKLYYTKGRSRAKIIGGQEFLWNRAEGVCRNIYRHRPVADEFPDCYRLPSGKQPPSAFEAYLKLYDLTVERGLKEVKELKRLLSVDAGNALCSGMDVWEPDMLPPGSLQYRSRNICSLKSRYLDFLDNLYGMESQPVWMNEFGNYGETQEEILLRRMEFLKQAPVLTKNRAHARNIREMDDKENIPTAKAWFCRLLDINRDEDRTVGNILPGHNLILMGTDEQEKTDRDRLNAMLVNERMLDKSYTEDITPVILPEDEKGKLEQYSRLRRELPVFNHNFINAGLFRGGIRPDNYKIVQAGTNEFMLVFRNREEDCLMNLGRTDDKEELNLMANILRRYLMELNHVCETLYIIEPVLSDPSRPFTLLLVLPSWTARFKSSRFREVCRELLRSLLPAHLTGTLYWLDVSPMQDFEDAYRLWRQALADNDTEAGMEMLECMEKALGRAEKQESLDDQD